MRITITDLNPNLPVSQKWLMMIRHFLANPLGEDIVGRDVLQAMYAEYKRHQKMEGDLHDLQAVAAAPVSALAGDLRTIRPHLFFAHDGAVWLQRESKRFMLIDDDGQVVYGAQSRVGDVLGIPNAGQGNRERIFNVLDNLQAAGDEAMKRAA